MSTAIETSGQLTDRERAILERLSAGLSDQQIADDLFLSLNTVKWYNRQIYSKLGVSSRTQAIARAREHEAEPPGAPPLTVHGPPAPATSFIGRSRDIAEVKRLLSETRLLSLTGTGGTGKTRLALRVMAEVAGDFAGGAWLVDLAPLSDPALVSCAIAEALRVLENPAEPLLDTLKRAIAGREMLLVIDNFEQVIPAAPLVSGLLAACPRLKILVTSRESLRVSGEQEYPVSALSLPPVDAATLSAVEGAEAGALFIQRARLTGPHVALADDSAPAIAQICDRLDGLPLAIELAAARCKMLTPQALWDRLSRAGDASPLRALASGPRDAPPRQRTMRDSIEWSHNLLEDAEKTLFARLAIFRGGRSLEAIEAVCGPGLPVDVFDGLASLVDKNLVRQQQTPGGDPRFVLLELIHEYAREQLEAGGEAEAIRRRHAEYFVALAERAGPELRLARYDDWCRVFDLEIDNLRAVLEWAVSGGDASLGVRLASALCLFWYGKGHHVEGLRWTQHLLERLDEVPKQFHPGFLISAGHMSMMTDLAATQGLFRQAYEIARAHGDNLQTAWALVFLSYAMHRDPAAAMPGVEESLAMFRDLGHLPGVAQALNIVGEIARIAGDDDRAMRAYEECLEISRQTGEIRRIGYMWNNLAFIAQHRGDHGRAIDLAIQALRLSRDRGDRHDMAETVEILAGSLVATGQPGQAARLLGLSAVVFESMGSGHQPSNTPEHDRILAEARARLGDSAFTAAWAEGRTLSLESTVDDLLSPTASA